MRKRSKKQLAAHRLSMPIFFEDFAIASPALFEAYDRMFKRHKIKVRRVKLPMIDPEEIRGYPGREKR